MLQLSSEGWAKARTFVEERARPVDRALFAYHFSAGTTGDVLRELAAYQNSDGGFGNWLEADFALPSSSAEATTVALALLREVDTPASHETVQGAVAYLLQTFDHTEMRWHAVPPAVNAWPHAPWWHYDETLGGSAIDRALGNPSAELTGYLNHYRSLVPAAFLSSLTETFVTRLVALPENADSMHEIYCYTRLIGELPAEVQEACLPKLRRLVRQVTEVEPSRWDDYVATPLFFVRHPGSPFAGLFPQALPANLDYLVGRQGPDGAWHPNWSWGQYEEAWEKAAQCWAGHLTVENLLMLSRFGRATAAEPQAG